MPFSDTWPAGLSLTAPGGRGPVLTYLMDAEPEKMIQ